MSNNKEFTYRILSMKQLLYPTLVITLAFTSTLAGCDGKNSHKNDLAPLPDTNMMKEDARLLAEKTAQCINMVDYDSIETNEEITPDSNLIDCTERLQQLEKRLEEKYKDSLTSVTFGHYYLQALQQTDIPQEMKELYKELDR